MFQRYWPQDEEGFLINDTSEHLLPEVATTCGKKIFVFLSISFPDEVISFYIRGSAAWGNFDPKYSDLDFFVIAKSPGKRWDCPEDLKTFLEKLSLEYGVPIECNFASLPQGDFFSSRPYLGSQIKCFSLLLKGKDLSQEIPHMGIGPHLTPHHRWYQEDLSEFKQGPKTSKDIQAMAKLSLRVGFELVMENEQRFTSCLPLCAISFLNHFPECREEIKATLSVFEEPRRFEGVAKDKILSWWNWLEMELKGRKLDVRS
ncbi:MAG: nucleotidyltransferase domain-containing protein [Saprospiraceae bacterium]|nr:nucleotidyltransferase domain-containing protein [Saprospiraceae bacterium]